MDQQLKQMTEQQLKQVAGQQLKQVIHQQLNVTDQQQKQGTDQQENNEGDDESIIDSAINKILKLNSLIKENNEIDYKFKKISFIN